jgi:hypothetical protein
VAPDHRSWDPTMNGAGFSEATQRVLGAFGLLKKETTTLAAQADLTNTPWARPGNMVRIEFGRVRAA